MERLKEFLDWHCENPHNVNFKMIVAKEDREETLKRMHEISELLDTGLIPPEIMELKERDMPKKTEINAGVSFCPVCGRRVVRCYDFCPDCGQRLQWKRIKWEG